MMSLNDETLSAFLDGELTETEMRDVRAALANEPALAERLASLALAEGLVVRQARALDDSPLPQAVLDLLREEEAEGKVVSLRPALRMRRFALPMTLAASLALLIGFGAGYFVRGPSPGTGIADMAAIAPALDSALSGEEVTLARADEAKLLARMSFLDPDGRYCRQFQVSGEEGRSENVACLDEGGWTLVASVRLSVDNAADYRPAAGNAMLDGILDTWMAGGALSLEDERRLVEEGWARGGR